MKKILNLSILMCLLSASVLVKAQESRFYMPREIKQAYENGTRSYDGKPGENYWQNTVDYTISVEIMPETRTLNGTEKAVLHNNSPNKLHNLVIRLYHDVFKKGNQRGMPVKESDINEGVEISKLFINGTEIDLEKGIRRMGTNMFVELPEPIASQSKATVEVDWEMTIPETTRRTGAYDSTSFFVSYWYPQIAVYDDLFGWDDLSYDFSTEFYNNLGNYDVKIKAPEQFTILATGELDNASEVLKDEQLKRYEQAKSSNETVTILSPEDINNGYKNKTGIWHYKASEVTDFSFCLSDHFIWDGAKQKVEDRNVFISSFYNINVAQQAVPLTSIQQKTMKHFSEDMPGIPYPYPEFTTCVMGIGGGGMETPMMANNGQPGRGVTIHEMFHTYFPMYVRINEKRFAWMDEGWANFNTTFVNNRYFEQDTSLLIEGEATQIQGTIGSIVDLPLITSTQFMDNTNYGYASYPLPSFLYNILYHHLGDELFKKCYRNYISTWAKKSPSPYDFFYTFERVSGQDLSWFWNPWFFRYGDVDISIASYNKGKLKIKNNGSKPVPVVVNVMYKDSTTWKADYSAKKWESQNNFTVEIPNHKQVAIFSVNEALPDGNIMDNYYPTIKERYGDFKLAEKYKGEYQIIEFPVTVIISEHDGLARMTITRAGVETYLLPKNDNSFQDLSGNYQLKLIEKEDGNMGIELVIKSFGARLTGGKK